MNMRTSTRHATRCPTCSVVSPERRTASWAHMVAPARRPRPPARDPRRAVPVRAPVARRVRAAQAAGPACPDGSTLDRVVPNHPNPEHRQRGDETPPPISRGDNMATTIDKSSTSDDSSYTS